MPIQILMPALSPTMTEGTLARWLKAEGDAIKPGDILAEIETDKATMEIEAIDGGILGKICVAEGSENVPVNTLIALVFEEGESLESLNELKASSEAGVELPVFEPTKIDSWQPSKVQSVKGREPGVLLERVLASPLARRIAAQSNIEISHMGQGSGPRGRIIKADVEAFIGHSKMAAPHGDTGSQGEYEEIKLSTMRKVIARRLVESKTTIPHFYLSIDCQIDALLKVRHDINNNLAEGQKISVNDFILKAAAKALKEVPDANASYHETHIRRYHHADISVAVAIEGGLVTPVVRRAETFGLLELAQRVKELVTRARAGSLTPEEYQGGTFSVSNLGMYGIKSFSAIINPPQGCILAVGAAEKRASIINDQVVPATLMNCTLSVDHRVIDGAVGALFFRAFKKYLENPLLLLI